MRTFYRALAAEGLVQERRNQLVHPAYVKPELVATGPSQVWSWDMTRLRSTMKWQFFCRELRKAIGGALKSRPRARRFECSLEQGDVP